jgi:hypothetical protein
MEGSLLTEKSLKRRASDPFIFDPYDLRNAKITFKHVRGMTVEQLVDLIMADDEARALLERLLAIAEDGCDGEVYEKLDAAFSIAYEKVEKWLDSLSS